MTISPLTLWYVIAMEIAEMFRKVILAQKSILALSGTFQMRTVKATEFVSVMHTSLMSVEVSFSRKRSAA
jgi:hypothetical protein